MSHKTTNLWVSLILLIILSTGISADRRSYIYRLGTELEKQAVYLAQSSYDHFKGWDGAFTDQEQAVLFKTEAFAASCRLFLRLSEERSGYYRNGYLRTNLFSAFTFLADSFKDLEKEMDRARIRPYSVNDCQRLLERIEYEFSKWPATDNLAYLHQKYVKARNAAVYWIERKSPGVYVRHAFKNLESIYRFNYDINRGKDPWKYLVEVPYDTLMKMQQGSMTSLTFEGRLIIEMSNRPNRPVFLIQNGKKRGITSPAVLQRYGGWNKVFEVPVEVVNKYPEGEPIK